MRKNKTYYTIQEMAFLLGVYSSVVIYRLKRLNISFCFEDWSKKGILNSKKYYSIDKFNSISRFGTKSNDIQFLVSNFDIIETEFATFESKINTQ